MVEKQDSATKGVKRAGFHGTHGNHGASVVSVKKFYGGTVSTPAVSQPSKGAFSSYHGVANGVSPLEVRSLLLLGLTRDDVRQIIPDRTLDRRIADGENLKIEEADGIARLLRVVTFARRVFADDVLADEWLRSANPSLDGLVPMHMARTDLGGREVEAILGRIEHGVFG